MNKKSKDAKMSVRNSTGKLLDEKAVEDLINNALKVWQTDYEIKITNLEKEVEEIQKSQKFISLKYDELKKEHETLLASNQKQIEEISQLKAQSINLETRNFNEERKIDALDQYGRRLNLEIAGVPIKENENTNEIVIEVARLANVDISKDQISTSHRLPAKPKTNVAVGNKTVTSQAPPPIIVRFLSRDVRNRLYSNRNKLRYAKMDDFSVKGTTKLFLNENLNQNRKHLFWNAKQKAKAHEFKFYWTFNGNIFVRKSEESEPICIQSTKDLERIKHKVN